MEELLITDTLPVIDMVVFQVKLGVIMRETARTGILLGVMLQLSLFAASSAFASSPRQDCTQRLQLLNSKLIIAYKKIPIMPTITKLVLTTRDTYDAAEAARSSGNYQECIRLADIGLRYVPAR